MNRSHGTSVTLTIEEKRKRAREWMRKRREKTDHASDKRYRENHREQIRAKSRINNKTSNPRRLKIKGKFHVLLKENPKNGVCSRCGVSVKNGEIPYTVWHHIEYDMSNPLAHTVELCPKCHRKVHAKEPVMTKGAISIRRIRARKAFHDGRPHIHYLTGKTIPRCSKNCIVGREYDAMNGSES